MVRAKWFWTLLPANIANGGISVLIPLYILSPYINGNVIDVALVVSAGNLAMIPASLFWGFMIDLFGKRKPFILISFAGRCLLSFSMYFTNNLALIMILYFLFMFVTVASVPSLNLLLMETRTKNVWGKAYIHLLVIAQIGVSAGSFIGIFWSISYSLKDYFLFLSTVSFPSIILAFFWIKEPKITLERRVMVKIAPSLIHRIHINPLFFLHLPKLSEFQRIYRILKFGITHNLPLIYISAFLFFVANGIFFATFTPFLKSKGLNDSIVFGLYALLSIGNTFTPLIGTKYTGSDDEDKAVIMGIGGRTILSLIMFLVALTGFAVVLVTIVVFPLWSVTYGLFFGPIATLLLKNLPPSKKGELLGLFSAVIGAGLFLGSLVSGYMVVLINYSLTFLIASSIFGIAAILMHRFKYAIH
jgi:MFS family permease